MKRSPCLNCVNRQGIPGDAHITCRDPPTTVTYVGGCGPGLGGTHDKDEAPNFDSAEERLEYADAVSKVHLAVVRCLWPGCGPFPGDHLLNGFDPGSVFACCNSKGRD